LKALIKIMLGMFAVFVAIFLIGRWAGWITADEVRAWLDWASTINPWLVAALIMGLLALDLVLSIPTILVTLLAGFFLGPVLGALTAFAGISIGIAVGYGGGRLGGPKVLEKLVPGELDREALSFAFKRHGPGMIVVARAMPMLPEITAILAGATGMKLPRFALLYLIGTIPYVFVVAFAGSRSDFDNPWPAVYGIIGVYVVLWLGWGLYQYVATKRRAAKEQERLRRKWRRRRRQKRRAEAQRAASAPNA
jgi:uncharacterized membrane protein YdjX (TVP38/TMEM64 family)